MRCGAGATPENCRHCNPGGGAKLLEVRIHTTGRAWVATAAQRSISSLLARCRLHGCSAGVKTPARWLQGR